MLEIENLLYSIINKIENTSHEESYLNNYNGQNFIYNINYTDDVINIIKETYEEFKKEYK